MTIGFYNLEFPNDKGNPYKSSGGKMVWNEELKKEIPEKFNRMVLKNIDGITIITGKTPSTKEEIIWEMCYVRNNRGFKEEYIYC